MKTEIVVAIACIASVSCEKQTTYQHHQRPEIRKAVDEMLSRDCRGSIWIEDISGKVRVELLYQPEFLDTKKDEIVFLMPNWIETEQQSSRAHEYFKKRGMKRKAIVHLTSSEVNSQKTFSRTFFSWQKAYKKQQSSKAINDSLGALQVIFGIGDSQQVYISKLWEKDDGYHIVSSREFMPDGSTREPFEGGEEPDRSRLLLSVSPQLHDQAN